MAVSESLPPLTSTAAEPEMTFSRTRLPAPVLRIGRLMVPPPPANVSEAPASTMSKVRVPGSLLIQRSRAVDSEPEPR